MDIKVPLSVNMGKNEVPTDYKYNPQIRACMQNDIIQGEQRAVIIFFSPSKKDIPHARRAHVYNLTENTFEAIDEALSTKDGNLYNSSFLLGSSEANKAILPSIDASSLYTKPFADMWSFFLIIDNESRLNSASNVTYSYKGPRNRFKYAGYCSEEPFSKLFGGYTLNPHCILTILHYDQTMLNSVFKPSGEKLVEQVTINEDIVNPSATLQMSNEDLVLLTPSSLRHGVVPDPSNNAISIFTDDTKISLAAMNQINKCPTISGDLKIPKQQFNHLAYTLASAIETNKLVSSDDIEYENKSNTGFRFSGPDVIRQAFDTSVKEMSIRDIVLGIDPKMPISLESLQQLYPNLQVHHFNLNLGERDIVDPMQRTAQNVFSDLIASSLSSIITEAGFVNFSFQYQSFIKNQFGIPGNFQVLVAETSLPWSSEIQKAKIKMLINDIELLVFPMIKTNVGEFSLMCSITNCGEAIVQLNLMDFSNGGGLYISNNLFGGLTSPLLGNKQVYQHNAVSLQSLLNRYDSKFNTAYVSSIFNNNDVSDDDEVYSYGIEDDSDVSFFEMINLSK